MWRLIFAFLFVLGGCAGSGLRDDMTILTPDDTTLYSVATIQKITDDTAPVHIYIEGDGRAFDSRGHATADPTPRSRFMQRMAAADTSPNVAYIARPCQFVMDDKCTKTDWTDGRFSKAMVDSVAAAVKTIAGTRPVVLVGFSGGAMISGLIIQNHSDIKVKQWITIAGVLNHTEWTQYFNDSPLVNSLNLNTLPRVPSVHYIAEYDKIVPNTLSRKWLSDSKMIVILNADHNTIPIMKLNFTD